MRSPSAALGAAGALPGGVCAVGADLGRARPKEELPPGLTHKAVREIARLRGHGAQRAAFGARWQGVLVEVGAKVPSHAASR